jgi:glycosyltransferase involved in cell wall biosynthesis
MRALLRPVNRTVKIARAHAQGAMAWVAGRPDTTQIRVAYGQRVPRPDERAVGGIVKLQHLQRTFIEDPRRFNVLYLVSSRLPDGAVALAQWAQRKGARVVLNQNGVAYPAWYGQGWERENKPMATLLAMADYVLYQSAFCKMSADRFAGPAAQRSEVLVNPVDTARFTTAPKPPGGHELTLLLSGSQDQWYRLESAVRTLTQLRRHNIDAELLVTGRLGWRQDSVAARQEADALVAEAGVKNVVSFLGPYTQEEAPAIYQRADIVVHTKYNDPCPTVVLEALACGRPVVYSRSGGVPELVGELAGSGVDAPLSWDRDIAPPPEALATCVLSIRERWTDASAAARRRAVELFDVKRWLSRHEAVFRDLLQTS